MRGLLVVNQFFNNAKFSEIYDWLRAAALERGIELKQYTNAQVIAGLAKSPDWLAGAGFVLFWDKDVRLAKLIERCGVRVFNSSSAIELCDDKFRTYLALKNYGIRMPKTISVPLSYFPVDWTGAEYLDEICAVMGFPVILKECYGSFGEQVFLIKSRDELVKTMNGIGVRPMIIQEFIESSSGRDLRLNVVGSKVVACMYRHSTNGDFRANVTNGGQMEAYEPSRAQVNMALRACALLDLDFGGVDLLFAPDGSPVLCEVNSNAHFKNIFSCTGVNVAEHIIAHIGTIFDGK